MTTHVFLLADLSVEGGVAELSEFGGHDGVIEGQIQGQSGGAEILVDSSAGKVVLTVGSLSLAYANDGFDTLLACFQHVADSLGEEIDNANKMLGVFTMLAVGSELSSHQNMRLEIIRPHLP